MDVGALHRGGRPTRQPLTVSDDRQCHVADKADGAVVEAVV
jgi:hypothetical protein